MAVQNMLPNISFFNKSSLLEHMCVHAMTYNCPRTTWWTYILAGRASWESDNHSAGGDVREEGAGGQKVSQCVSFLPGSPY